MLLWRLQQDHKNVILEKSGLKKVEQTLDKLIDSFDYEHVNKLFETLNNLHGIIGLIEISRGYHYRHRMNIPKRIGILIRSIQKVILDPSQLKLSDFENIEAKLRICFVNFERLLRNITMIYSTFYKKKEISLKICLKLKYVKEVLPFYIDLLQKSWTKKISKFHRQKLELEQEQEQEQPPSVIFNSIDSIPPPPPPFPPKL